MSSAHAAASLSRDAFASRAPRGGSCANVTPRRRHVIRINNNNKKNNQKNNLAGASSSSTSAASSSSSSSSSSPSSSRQSAEDLLLSRLRNVGGRGAKATAADERAIAEAVTSLETEGGGLSDPATRPEIQGTWRLLYTSKSEFDIKNPLGSRVDGTAPGIEGFFASIFGDETGGKMTAAAAAATNASSSPIQRTVTSLEAFTIQQAIRLGGGGGGGKEKDDRVDQVVQFGDGGYLRLSAAASVVRRENKNCDVCSVYYE